FGASQDMPPAIASNYDGREMTRRNSSRKTPASAARRPLPWPSAAPSSAGLLARPGSCQDKLGLRILETRGADNGHHYPRVRCCYLGPCDDRWWSLGPFPFIA